MADVRLRLLCLAQHRLATIQKPESSMHRACSEQLPGTALPCMPSTLLQARVVSAGVASCVCLRCFPVALCVCFPACWSLLAVVSISFQLLCVAYNYHSFQTSVWDEFSGLFALVPAYLQSQTAKQSELSEDKETLKYKDQQG